MPRMSPRSCFINLRSRMTCHSEGLGVGWGVEGLEKVLQARSYLHPSRLQYGSQQQYALPSTLVRKSGAG